jgi:protein O-mannosyl-transferase
MRTTKRHRGKRAPKRIAGDIEQAPSPGLLLVIVLSLAALNIIVYQAIRNFQFIGFDDPTYVTANPAVQAGLSWSNVLWALTSNYAPSWHPVTWLSHMVDVQVFGLDAGAHHLTNAVLHTANTLLLFGWLHRQTRALWPSVFVAAVFAVHPLHVESVAWVSERKDVLSACFWLLALWAYGAYAARPSVSRYLWVLGAFCLGLMSKPSVVALPVVLLLVDIWPLRRVSLPGDRAIWIGLGTEKLPLLALALVISGVTFVFQARAGAVSSVETLSLGSRVANAVVGYAIYLWKTVWPSHLAVFYPLRSWSIWAALASGLGLLTVTAGCFRACRTHPYLIIGWLWYVVTLLPMIGLVQVGQQSIADRYMYIPMIGILIMIAWGVPDLVGRWPAIARARLVPAIGVAIVLVSTVAARAQVLSWSDDVALWQQAIRNSQDNYLAYVNLGRALVDRNDLSGALEAYGGALGALKGRWPAEQGSVHCDIGLVFSRQGRTAEALGEFSQATRLNPDLAEAQVGEGNVLATERHLPEAIEHFSAALRIRPDVVSALTGIGGALLAEGRPADAIPYYVRALGFAPNDADTHDSLGSALAMAGRNDEAMAEFQAALRLKPDLTTAYFNLGVLLAGEGKLDDARRSVEQALAIDPTYGPARQFLANLGKTAS